ncbi:dihydrodipicolinate synthase family protein [Halosimplex aquaticum]|uniref:Dihydrodipicolinate synthase family protein n=1 Tax=Halosimplex aquaticum TaxID=3026162 RepID=A0ABD5XUF1_9EURY|nr:dihydrodipicolinate synthase family protein [Halosimplex aquaticum]
MQPQRLRRNFESVAFTTAVPFTDDRSEVDTAALADNVERLYDRGARLFIPCGNTGEYYALTDEERAAVVETHVEATGPEATVAGGVVGNVPEVSRLASTYADAGADAIMVMHPDHTYVHEEGLKTYYHRICDETDLGVVLYKRGRDLPRGVIVDLSEREEVVAVKFGVADVKEFAQTVQDADGELTWVNGIAERYALAFAVEGASGYTTGLGNFLPRTTLALYEAIENGHWERARTIQRSLRPLEDLRDSPGEGSTVAGGNNVPVVKYGMDLAGFRGGPVREPLVDLDSRGRERVERHYDRIEGTFGNPA